MTTEDRAGRPALALALCFLALAGGASTARAQDLEAPRPRQGYYLTIGGQGTAVTGFDDGRTDSLIGGAGSLRLGQMLTSRLGLGIRIDAGAASGDGVDSTNGGFAIEGQVRPWGDLALHAGVGLGFLNLTRPALHPGMKAEQRGGYGAVYSLDVSHDWFLTRRRSGGWSLAPTLGLRYLPGDGARALSLLLGGQLSWWSGRPRDQLILPEREAYD
jgi:hypothetical protein